MGWGQRSESKSPIPVGFGHFMSLRFWKKTKWLAISSNVYFIFARRRVLRPPRNTSDSLFCIPTNNFFHFFSNRIIPRHQVHKPQKDLQLFPFLHITQLHNVSCWFLHFQFHEGHLILCISQVSFKLQNFNSNYWISTLISLKAKTRNVLDHLPGKLWGMVGFRLV